MSFDEVRLPENIEQGAQGGPRFNTTVLTLSSGYEKRNQDWSQARASWDLSYAVQGKADLASIIAFFRVRRGRARGFRFKDWSDFRVAGQLIGTGDGAATAFQLFKRYSDAGGTYDRIIKKPVSGTIEVRVNSVVVANYTLDVTTGIVTFDAAPADTHPIEASFQFDVAVRFDTDQLDVNMLMFDETDDESLSSVPAIPIVEIRVRDA